MVNKMITCPKCGHKNLFPSKECAKCGSSFILFPELRALFEKEEQSNIEVTEPIPKTYDQQGGPLICPRCGQEYDSLSVECSKCGIVFLKYYEILARDETDEDKKAEFLVKQKEEEERAEALRKQKEEEERAEALRKQKEEEERAQALRKKEEEERAEDLRRQKEEEEKKEFQKRVEDITKVLKPRPKIKDLLKKYEGQAIGINYNSPSEIKSADLIKIGEDFFSILITDDKLIKSYPLINIMSVIEKVNGVSPGNMEEKAEISFVIQVYHPVF